MNHWRSCRSVPEGCCGGDYLGDGNVLGDVVECTVGVSRRKSICNGAGKAHQDEIGLIGLEDLGDSDSVVLKLRESHSVARLGESGADSVCDDTLDGRGLARGAVRGRGGVRV